MRKKRSAIFLVSFLGVLFLAAALLHSVRRDENQKFEDYTSELFRQEAAANSISLHYTLKNPASYNIGNAPLSFGSVSTDTDAICASAENALALLHNYKRERLSEENRLTYDILEASLNASFHEASYALYEEPLSPLTGTQAQLPLLLSEYHFYTIGDCENYLNLLPQLPEYFQSIITFERAKADAGLFMSDKRADDVINECEAFIQTGDSNYLYSSFEERLNELSNTYGELSEEQAAKYIRQNRSDIEAYVFPAYQQLIDALTELRGAGKNNCGLCYLPDGRKYYELTVAAQTGSSRTIPELQALTLSQMAEDSAAIQETLASGIQNTDNTASFLNSSYDGSAGSDLEEILSDLRTKLDGIFPEPPEVNTQIKYVEESMEEYLSPAFYMIPAIDDTANNVIYINRGHMPDELTLFTTLAHEGYPGHLYQTTYYSSTNPAPIRNLLNFGGYTEGWATYTEMMSYYFSSLPEEQAALLQHNSSLILGLYALADMGIHYDGWTLLDTVSFFRGYGITDTETIEEIYSLIVGDPGNYLKYYIGYVEFLELKKDAVKKWGDSFTQERFHKEILEIGPAPFDILRKYMLGTG